MIVDKGMIGTIYVAAIGDEEITEAVNMIQKVYDDFLAPAWKKMEENKEEGGKMVASHSVAFIAACAAFVTLLTEGMPESMEEMFGQMVGEVVSQMKVHLAEKKKLIQGPQAKA